jgi:hypothetical protein
LLAWRKLFLVSLQRQPPEIPAGSQPLLKAWRAAKVIAKDPVNAWESIVGNEQTRKSYQQVRGKGGFVRADWEEVNEIIAAANVYTAKNTALTALSASRRFLPCRWCPMRRAAVTCR